MYTSKFHLTETSDKSCRDTTQSGRQLLCEHEELSLIPSTHIGRRVRWRTVVILELGK